MEVLDAGTENISNMDVLEWMKRKREQHAAEDAEDAKKGIKPSPRPQNFLNSLTKHERELKDPKKYPYTKNPKAYDGTSEAMERFDMVITERICFPLEEKYKGKGLTIKEVDAQLGKEQEEKGLTETEHLMLLNHAPQCVEQLQPMIENAEDRFTPEELQIIMDCVVEVYRADEKGRSAAVAANGGPKTDAGAKKE